MKSENKIAFTVDNQEIKDALSLVVKASSAKSNLPVLSNKNICFILNRNSLSLFACNLEHSILVEVNCENEINTNLPDISFVAPYDNIYEILKDCPDSVSMVFDTKRNILSLSSKSSKVNIKCIDGQEYPSLPKIKKGVPIDLSEFSNAISAVQVCSSTNPEKVILGTVNICQKNLLTVSGADGYAMGRATLSYKSDKKFDINFPLSAVQSLLQFLSTCSDETYIFTENNSFSVNGKNKYQKNINFFSNLVVGNYPDLNQIIPKSHETFLVVDIASMLKVFSLCKSFVTSNTLTFNIKKDSINVKSTSEEGDYEGSVDCLIFKGNEMGIGLSLSYLNDILTSIKKYSSNKNVTFKFNTANSPVLIHPEDDENLIFVLMPMHLGK